MDEPSGEMCAIQGQKDTPLTKGEFNEFVARVRYYHLRPLRDDVKEIKHMLVEQARVIDTHIDNDREFFAKLAGARWAIYVMAGCLAFLLPLIWQLIKALNLANVL